MSTLIAEDLLLLLLDDETGKIAASDRLTPALGGALLLELALAERVEVGAKSSRWQSAKVEVVATATATATGEPMLDQALSLIADKPRTAQDLVNRLGKGAKDQLLERLSSRGMIERHDDKVLGIFARTTWPAADAGHEESVRTLLQGALVGGLTPDARTSALIALLSAIDQAHKVVQPGDVSPKEVKARAKTIAEGEWAAKAVKDAVVAVQAAMMAAVVASTTAAASAGN